MKFPARNFLKLIQDILTIKFVGFLFLFLSIFFLLTPSLTHAQEENLQDLENTTYTTSPYSNINNDVPLNTNTGVQVLFIEFVSTIHCQLTGENPINENGKCLGFDKETGKIGYVESGGGAIAAMGKLIDSTMIPPASGLQYVAYLKDNFGITKPTYAQVTIDGTPVGNSRCHQGGDLNGLGFCQIEFLLPIWEVMRNIVYLLFVLVFIIIGIGIMLRLHIDPRTVMTIQNQIPKIIIGIIAITFSFAIAGFLIDVMWIAVYLFTAVILSVGAGDPIDSVFKITQATNPINAGNSMWPGSDLGIFEISRNVASAFSDIIEGAVNEVIPDLLGNILGGVLDVLGTIILFIAILIALIRLWVKLIVALVNIILDVILAPWWILGGLIPGSSMGVGVWLRDLIANLSVFPVTIAFFLLASWIMVTLTNMADTNSTQDNLRSIGFPLIGGTNPVSLAYIIGFGFLMTIPNLLDSMKQLLKAPKGGFGNIFGPVGASIGYSRGVASNTAGIMAGRNELVMKQKGPDKYDWGKKGFRTGITQRLFR